MGAHTEINPNRPIFALLAFLHHIDAKHTHSRLLCGAPGAVAVGTLWAFSGDHVGERQTAGVAVMDVSAVVGGVWRVHAHRHRQRVSVRIAGGAQRFF